jgi:hypothetical protein
VEPFVNEIILFLHSQKQSVEVNPTDCFVTDYDCLLIREQQLIIIINYLSVSYEAVSSDLPKDFRVIHLWEDVWKTSDAIIKSRLLSAIGKSVRLPGRVTQVRRIDKPTADSFLTEHHLQGSPKAKFKYGLFLPKNYYRLVKDKTLIDENADEILVAVATFAAPKTYYRNDEKSRSIELIRFTNHSAFTIIGGVNKLLKFLEKEQQPDDIMTYVDADWSDGKAFKKLGFERIEKIEPITFYVHKITHERHKYLPESETADNYAKVCNSGSWKMIRKIDAIHRLQSERS